MGDSLFPQVLLLLQFGSTSEFADYSVSEREFTAGGDAVVTDDIEFSGSGMVDVEDFFYVYDGSVSVEMPARIDAANNTGTHILWTNSGATNAETLALYTDSGALKMRTGSTVTTVQAEPDYGTTHNYDFQKDGDTGTCRFFVDGEQTATWSDSTDYGEESSNFRIGRSFSDTNGFTGLVGGIRITAAPRRADDTGYTPESLPWPEFWKNLGGTVTGVDDGISNPNAVSIIVFKATDLNDFAGGFIGSITPVCKTTSEIDGSWLAPIKQDEEHVVLFLDRRDQFSGGPNWYNHKVLRMMPNGGEPVL